MAILSTDVPLHRASAASIRRPRYSVLDNAALNAADANMMQDWRASLASHLKAVERETS